MNQAMSAPLFAGSLFVGMLLMVEIGRRVGAWRIARNPESAEISLGPVDGAIFALFGLLIAFTFSGAGDRFDSRRRLITEEANAIGTAYLRLELLPEDSRAELQAAFRDYLSSRLETYRLLPDLAAAYKELGRSQDMQGSIWSRSIAASRLEGAHPDAAKLLLPALNEMIDITTTRAMAARTHPPFVIYALLFAFGLACSLFAGFAMAPRKEKQWPHVIGFALATAIAIFVIVDLEYPRHGLFQVTDFDQVLVDLLEDMK